jgi:hypothetical protein
VSASKRKGNRWETAIVDYLRAQGWPHAERLIPGAQHDRGDIAGLIGLVIEAKNQARHSFAEWVDEANLEATNAGAALGVVWAHRRGFASPADAYVVMDGRSFVRLLKAAGWES